MPRESTRRSTRFEVLDGGTCWELEEQGATAWVALSGVLDRDQLQRLIARVRPLLRSRGRRIVLDGRRLRHVDYRAVPALIAWNDGLRAFNHQLLLYGWNGYLRTILAVGDAGQRFGPVAVRLTSWPRGETAGPELVP
jgi:ABC-type transporter Mla MlaB component